MGLLNAVSSALNTVIQWVGVVVKSIVNAPVDGVGGELHALLPLLAVGISISALMLGIRAIKSFIWGA